MGIYFSNKVAGETINYTLKDLDPESLADLLDRMCVALLRGKALEACREPLDKSLMVGGDGTGLFSTVIKIPHTTFRRHGDGTVRHHVYVLVIAFLSPEALYKAGKRSELCLACFSGDYPTYLYQRIEEANKDGKF